MLVDAYQRREAAPQPALSIRYHEKAGTISVYRAGHPAAVLLRAAESPSETSASGPGRLTRVFAVDRELDGSSLLAGPLWLEAGEAVPDRAIRRTARIGVDYAGVWARRRYRFIIAGHPAAIIAAIGQ